VIFNGGSERREARARNLLQQVFEPETSARSAGDRAGETVEGKKRR